MTNICYSYWTKKPDDISWGIWWCCTIFDWVFLSAFVIWASIVMSKPQTEECRVQSGQLHNYWMSCCVILAGAWCYIALLCCICNIVVPIVSCCLCVICCFGVARARERAN